MKKIIALALSLFGVASLNDLKGESGKVELTDEQKELMTKALGDPKLTENFVAVANKELSAQEKLAAKDAEQAKEYAELAQLLAENGIDDLSADGDEDNDAEEDNDVQGEDTKSKASKSPVGIVKQLISAMKEYEAQIASLSTTPEPDNPVAVNNNTNIMQHSATHLFGSSMEWDKFANRPWNQRLKARLAGQEVKAEEYSELDYEQITADFKAYQRDRDKVVSFTRGLSRLPANWPRLSGVQNELWYASLFLGEITQGRKKSWLPKGKFQFQPEKAKVYPTQIDLTFNGYDLQKIEATWLGKYNQEGASPFKMSFVEMLMQEVYKKQAEEDGIALIKGVYYPTDDAATEAGSFLHRMPGILKLIQNAITDRKLKPFAMGIPTNANIYDYVQEFVGTNVPKDWRDLPGMVLYMDIDLERAYHKSRELRKGTMPTYEPGKMTVDHYENVRIEPLYGIGEAMFMTHNDNIKILEGLPGESSKMNMQQDKRDVNLFGDYKMGIHVDAFGYKWPAGTVMTAEKQMFFTNDVFALQEVQVPTAENATVLSAEYHNSIQTGVNTQATAITNITNVTDGQTVYIYGNTGANPSTIANAGNFDLASSVTLDENTYIVLRKRASDGKFVEIERGDLSTGNVVVLDADATVADASQGTHFLTSANTGATAITDIENAVEGIVYKIEGGSDTNATTIAASGNFARISALMTLGEGDYIEVVWNGSVFVEVDRFTA